MFVLYNNHNSSYLTHPAVGMWYTENKQEADEMLQSAHNYVKSLGMDFMIDEIVVKEVSEDTMVKY